MQLSFTKSYELDRIRRPFPGHPKGLSDTNNTFKITPQDGSTFDQDAILVGTQEERSEHRWAPVRTNYLSRYKTEHLDQPTHQLGTWIDHNQNGIAEDSEVRSFADRIGDTNHNHAGGYSTITLDLAVSEGERGAWYISEQLGVRS